MKRLLAIPIGSLWLLTAGWALAGPGDPIGGDDPGCAPATKDDLKCKDGNLKAFAKAYQAVIKCHTKQADAAFKAAAPNDDEACETSGAGKSAKEKLDAARAKLTTCPASAPGNVTANVDALETTLFASKTTSGSADQQNGAIYCDGAQAVDSGGDDAGTVDSTPTAKGKLQCADAVAKNLGKLLGAVGKCHVKSADAQFKGVPGDDELCETGPGGKSALEKYTAATDAASKANP